MLYANHSLNNFLTLILTLIAYLMALIVAISFHEFAHAFAAKKEGDNTAKAYGRYTLAPHAHFDLIGFLFLLLFRFGWAKPVPVDSRNFKRGKKSAFWVASAGIITNIILGVIFLFIYIFIIRFFPQIYDIPIYGELLFYFLNAVVSLNFSFAFLNLLPLYPLDGHRIIESFSKTENAFLRATKQYSLLIMILISVTGLYQMIYVYTSELLIMGLADLFSKMLGF